MSEIKNRGGIWSDRKPIGQQLRDAEDFYWGDEADRECKHCGHTFTPSVDGGEFAIDGNYECRECLDAFEAQDYLMHMVQMTERK